MKIYLAGPMQGHPHFNFPSFDKATKYLRDQGYTVFSPAEKDIERHGSLESATGNLSDITNKGFSLRVALADDTHYICTEADGIAMLPGWENSKGAQAEWALARALGHKILYLKESDYNGG